MSIGMWAKDLESRRERVAASGDDTKVKAYRAAETREALGYAKLGGSLVTGDPVTGGAAALEIIDAAKERWDILGSVED